MEGEKPAQKVRTTIEQWRDQFLQDAVARNLSHGTMRLYKLLFRQLLAFATERGISLANNMDLTTLTEFRATWKLGSLTASKKLERLRSIYKFALQRKMVDENFALGLVGPKVKPNPTLPFPKEEEVRILKAAESPKVDPRVKAFILTMRYSGLRISDVATLAVDSLKGNRLTLYQAKTGEFVSVLIPPYVAEALRSTPHKNPKYFFWKIGSDYGDGQMACAYCRGLQACQGWECTPTSFPVHVRCVPARRRGESRERKHATRPSERTRH